MKRQTSHQTPSAYSMPRCNPFISTIKRERASWHPIDPIIARQYQSVKITLGRMVLLSGIVLFCGLAVAAAPETGSMAAAPASDPTIRQHPHVDSILHSAQTDSVVPASSSPPAIQTVTAPPQAKHADSTAADSLRKTVRRDSLLALEGNRRSRYYPSEANHDTAPTVTESDFFRFDPVIWYDIPKVKRYAAGPKPGFVNSFNRLLPYGNTAPLDRRFFGTGLLYQRFTDPFSGDDAAQPTEYGNLCFPGDGTVRYVPRTVGLVSPEIALSWETGVFDGNFLNVRFSRPILRNLTVNVFSNYRYLKGMQFDHNDNNMYSMFSAITADTSLLSNRSYNPLVNEYHCGADAAWSAGKTHAVFRIKYGDIVDEVPYDRPTADAIPELMRVARYPLSFVGSISTAACKRYYFDAEAAYTSEHLRRTFAAGETLARFPRSTATSVNTFSGALRTGIFTSAGDSISLQFSAGRHKLTEGDSIEATILDGRPELTWHRPFDFRFLKGGAVFRAGYNLHSSGTTDAGRIPLLSGTIHSEVLGGTVNAYAEKDVIAYTPFIDTTSVTGAFYDGYFRTGIEADREWNLAGLLIGYQWCNGIDSAAVARAWLSGAAPYDQPQSSFIIAPRLGRWHGLSLSSRLMLSDSRPYVKVQSQVSLLAFPKKLREAIELRLGIDYWSKRDPITFAGVENWNRPVLDLNLAISAHIKSFRLIYKVDNLLNRNFSYLPGWYSPGITFRWGFSWFIQR